MLYPSLGRYARACAHAQGLCIPSLAHRDSVGELHTCPSLLAYLAWQEIRSIEMRLSAATHLGLAGDGE
jgi:hypothetical protein